MMCSVSAEQLVSSRRGYNEAAGFYDQRTWVEFWRRNEKPSVLKLVGRLDKRVVLDIGCGTGFYTLDLLRRDNLVYGIDVSSRMLESLREKLDAIPHDKRANVNLCLASVEKMPFKDGAFDLIVAARVLSHVKGIQLACSEIARVLKSGGYFVLSDIHEDHNYEHTILRDPNSSVEVAITTYKRPPSYYIQALAANGLHLSHYAEVSVRDGSHSRRVNPVLFISKFCKCSFQTVADPRHRHREFQELEPVTGNNPSAGHSIQKQIEARSLS